MTLPGMSEDPMRFSIDDHDLTVIRFQKSPMTPIAVKSIDLHAGYRYDVIVTGNPNPTPGYVR
jgi:FtsP/CotA-like multicopper oxidase with cupredoxin domain